MTEQEALAAEILDGFTPLDDNTVPTPFSDFVMERIAARPSPTSDSDPLDEINRKLDEVLTLLRGTTE